MDQPARRPRRDRRGRGMRGPGILPTRPGRPVQRTSRERFDDLVLDLVADLEERWADRLGLVEYAVEEAPHVPPGGTPARDSGQKPAAVPLALLVRGSGATPTRVVLFRRPIEHRCETRSELESLVLTVLAEQVAELLGIRAEDVDPRYDPD